MRHFFISKNSITFQIIILLILFVVNNAHSKENLTLWKGNSIGKEEIVLPGYDSIKKIKSLILLGKRKYNYSGNNYLKNVFIDGDLLVTGMYLELVIDGETYKSKINNFRFVQVEPSFAMLQSELIFNSDLKAILKTRIEYDGVSMVDAELVSNGEVNVSQLNLVTNVKKNKYTVVMGYKAKGIRRQKSRDDIIHMPYKGEFLNVVSISNGESSFWWFADNAEGWIWNDSYVTSVTETSSDIRIKQKIIGDNYKINKKFNFKFNYLVTPIKSFSPLERSKRIIWGEDIKPSKNDKNFKIWWTNAFAYDAYPYTEYPLRIKEKLSSKDIHAFKGRAYNKNLIRTNRINNNIYLMPYFSAHVLSELDDILVENKKKWKIEPEKIFKDGLNPYSNLFDKPVLTHRSKDYTDYVLWRLSEEIDNLDMDGIYLDHGAPVDSNNIYNGGWYDSNGILRSSLDILGLRSFLKRLRTLFYTKGKFGYIFIHISNREIIPAYTYVYGLIDGEQYRKYIDKLDYQDMVDINQFRHRFSGKQYGINSYWLPVDWTAHIKDRKWKNSLDQKKSYRKYLSLALSHDIFEWPHSVHIETYVKIHSFLDNFGISKSDFIGYWKNDSCLISNDTDVIISRYKHNEKESSIFVLSNISNVTKHIKLKMKVSECFPITSERYALYDIDNKSIEVFDSSFDVAIAPRDFKLYAVKAVEKIKGHRESNQN